MSLIMLVLLFNVSCIGQIEKASKSLSISGYPGDLLNRQTQDNYDPNSEILTYGFEEKEFIGEVYFVYGGIGFTNIDDLQYVFSNEDFSQDFYNEHKVHFPKSIMIPALTKDMSVDYNFIFDVKKNVTTNTNIGVITMVFINTDIYSTDTFISFNQTSISNFDNELMKIAKEAQADFIIKNYEEKEIHFIEIDEESNAYLNMRPDRSKMTLYLWEENEFIGLMLSDKEFSDDLLQYCSLTEFEVTP